MLRAIAGLARPTGRIALDGEVWLDAEKRPPPPEERRVGLVFQEYALFPHLSVERNVAFGGKQRVAELLERFRISHLAEQAGGALRRGAAARRPGARARTRPRRVAARRAALGARRPYEGRGAVELQELLRAFDLPTLIVTHDYEDAAALAEHRRRARRGRAAPARLAGRARLGSRTIVRGVIHRRQPAPRPRAVARRRAHPSRLESGEIVYSTDSARARSAWSSTRGTSRSAASTRDDSAINLVHGEIASVSRVGNRVRVRVGPLTAEVTAPSAERLELARGGVAIASFKATGTRLVPLAG